MNEKTKDTQQLIVSYEALESQGATLKEKIEVLKELKKISNEEEWSYRLAETYDKAGMTKECLEQCDELLLWYNNGTYTKVVLELKNKYDALTPLQRVMYNGFMEKESESLTDRLPALESYINRNIKAGTALKESSTKSETDVMVFKKEKDLKPSTVEIAFPPNNWEEMVQATMQKQLPSMLDASLQKRIPDMLDASLRKQLTSMLDTALQEQLPSMLDTSLQEQLSTMLDAALREQLPSMLKEALKEQLPSILKKVMSEPVTAKPDESRQVDASAKVQTDVSNTQQAESSAAKKPAKSTLATTEKQNQSQCYLMVGSRGTFTSKEAVKAIKALQKYRDIGGRIVKITATKMTNKTLKIVSEMKDLGVFVIENAAELSPDIAKTLNEVLDQQGISGLVVLADENDALKSLLMNNRELKGKFASGIRY